MSLRKSKNWTKTISMLATACFFSTAGAAFAAVPTVVVDAQESLISTGLSSPQSVAVAPNGTYYVADAGNNRVVAVINGVQSIVNTAGGTTKYTLNTPNALAVDSSGDLFIGDSPSSGTGRVLEVVAANGVLGITVKQVVSGGSLKDVFSLTVATLNGTNTLYIGDDLSSAIYYVTAGSTTLHTLTTGLPTDVVPAALAVDASGNLYVADFYSTLYELASGSTKAVAVDISGFSLNSPTGLTFDPAGNLYVLTLLNGTGFDVQNYILEIPATDLTVTAGTAWNNAFEIPVTGLGNGSAIALNTTGTLYVVDYENNDLQALIYGAAVNLGTATVGTAGTPVTFNYEINSSITSSGFQTFSLGDVSPSKTSSTEIQNASGTCTLSSYTKGNSGSAIGVANPYTCTELWYAEPSYPGIRSGAIAFTGPSNAVYAATPVFSTGDDGASVIYPLTASNTATDIAGPTGFAVSGLDQKLYVVEAGAAEVFSTTGTQGTALTQVSTTPITMSNPYKAALNGNGDLYIADFGVYDTNNPSKSTIGQIVVVPRSSSQTPYSSKTTGSSLAAVQSLLEHPLSVTFDTYGNLYIGDAGSDGTSATTTNHGYIVEVPANGAPPFELTITGQTIIYPQAIATDPYTEAVYVGDGGDASGFDQGTGAKVVEIPSGGGKATNVTPTGVTDPVEIVFDPAEQYYVLDGSSDNITVVPPSGTSYVLPFASTSLFTYPTALAITNGGQNFVEANLYSDTKSTQNNLVFLNGKSSSLAFASTKSGSKSATLTATVDNIGTTALTLGSSYYSPASLTPFSFTSSTTCASKSLSPAATCAIVGEFSPTSTGSFSQTVTLTTNGYVTNDSVLNLSGTGTSSKGGLVTQTDAARPSSQVQTFNREEFFSHSHATSGDSHFNSDNR